MSFAETSNNIWLDESGVLHAECTRNDEDLQASELNLNDYIGVENGDFTFARGGFIALTKDVELIGDDNSTIQAAVLDENTNQWILRNLDLNLCVGNFDGVLEFQKPDFDTVPRYEVDGDNEDLSDGPPIERCEG